MITYLCSVPQTRSDMNVECGGVCVCMCVCVSVQVGGNRARTCAAEGGEDGL